VIECFALAAEVVKLNENGLIVGISRGLSKSADTLANLKSCNALIYAIAARQAKDQKWNDALVCNTAGNIIESTIANIFWIKDGTIYTAPLSDGCIAGVMRRHLMEKVAVKEQSLTRSALLQADEVFLTNAVKGIRWVSTIHDTSFKKDKVRSLHLLTNT
jgi:branched-chain amino acid aminotransferase